MKKALTIIISLLLIISLVSCKKNKDSKYKENLLYSEPVYEPLELASENSNLFILSTDLLGVYKGVKAAAWDDYDIKLRVKYSDYTIRDFPLKVKNIPIDMRHTLGEVGTHHLYFVENKWTVSHEFEIIENKDFKGFKCEFFDKDKKILQTKYVGYYDNVSYDGPELDETDEDYGYKYTFTGWDKSLNYICQDTQFLAKYEKLEKRYYADKPYNTDHIGISALVNQDKTKGSGLVYLGRVRHVAAFYSETQELIDSDLTFGLTRLEDYNKFFNELNLNIVNNSIEIEEDEEYSSLLYGNIYDLVQNPTFAMQFDKRYEYSGIKSYLTDEGNVELAYKDPYERILNMMYRRINQYHIVTLSKNEDKGYYRYALVMSFDVYLSVSFNYLEKGIYELSSFNEFIMSPVDDSLENVFQYSKDGSFDSNFDSKLTISTKGLYWAADMIDWRKD